jgi:hypothetical protein
MEQIDFSQIPYSQHHREAAMMLGAPNNLSVFTYLFDEYLFKLRSGKPTAFTISRRRISDVCQMNWRTVQKTLDKLEVMKLITIDEDSVSVDGDMYLSLISAFHNVESNDKQRFTDALSAGKFEELDALGYVFLHNCSNSLKELVGSLCKSATGVAEIQQPLQKYNTCCKNTQGVVKVQHVLQKYNTESDESVVKIQHLLQKCRTVINECCKNTTESAAFLHNLSDILDDDTLNAFSNAIFDENCTISEEQGCCIFAALLVEKCCKNTTGVLQKYNTEINKINNKKINQQAGDFFENFEPSEIDDSFNELPDNLPKIRKGGKHFQKVEYPYFPASEVLSFIQDIHQCLDDDVKLFLYNFNQELHARYDQDAEYDDETGELIKQESTVDTSQLILPKSEVEDIASTAISNTRADITDRNIYVNDEQVEITAIDNLDRLIKFNIMDWDFKLVGDGEKVCQIDWGKIQNPNAEPMNCLQQSSKRSRRTKDGEVNTERELNKQYIASIIEHSAEDETWEKLSPMEKLIYNFLCDHFEFSEDGLEVVDVKEEKKYLNRNMLFLYFQKELDSRPDTPSQEDFFSTFAKDKPDTYGGIKLRPNMFSAVKIQHWNSKHGFQSAFSTSSIQVTTEEEKTSQNV